MTVDEVILSGGVGAKRELENIRVELAIVRSQLSMTVHVGWSVMEPLRTRRASGSKRKWTPPFAPHGVLKVVEHGDQV